MEETLLLTEENHAEIADKIREFCGENRFTVSWLKNEVEQFIHSDRQYKLSSVSSDRSELAAGIKISIAGAMMAFSTFFKVIQFKFTDNVLEISYITLKLESMLVTLTKVEPPT